MDRAIIHGDYNRRNAPGLEKETIVSTYAQVLPALTNSLYQPKSESGGSNAIAFAETESKPTSVCWLEPTVRTLQDLLQLPQDWDGYGSVQVREDIAQQVLMALVEVMENDSCAPSVVSLSDGGVQVEWHRRGRNLEIEFPADEAPNFYYYEDESGFEGEGQVSRSYEQIRTYVARLKRDLPGMATEHSDDPNIPDEERLFRRIHLVHVVNCDGGKSEVSSAAFRDIELSVNLESVMRRDDRGPEDSLKDYPNDLLMSISAGLCRRHEQLVGPDPTIEEPAHGYVFGKKSKSIQRALRDAAQWIAPKAAPSWEEICLRKEQLGIRCKDP